MTMLSFPSSNLLELDWLVESVPEPKCQFLDRPESLVEEFEDAYLIPRGLVVIDWWIEGTSLEIRDSAGTFNIVPIN